MNGLDKEIKRTYRVLGVEMGFLQNEEDIKVWKYQNIVNDKEASLLSALNSEIYSKYRIKDR